MTQPLYQSCLRSLPLLAQGKVRDIYAVDDDKLLIVATDRLSAFDVVLEDPIPGKGAVLTQLTEFWLHHFRELIPNHMTGIDPREVVSTQDYEQVKGRSMVVKRLRPILVEAVARGYLSGSGWADYQRSGAVCGVELPQGLQLSEKLPQAIFTPAAKAALGEHDENISFKEMVGKIGEARAHEIRDVTLELYKQAAAYAASHGIIIADTKFEFGLDDQNQLHLIDEVLTPDSSRFWPAECYELGSNPPSFDKQFVRDWLLTQEWDKTAPAPRLPESVIEHTAAKYQEALQKLTN